MRWFFGVSWGSGFIGDGFNTSRALGSNLHTVLAIRIVAAANLGSSARKATHLSRRKYQRAKSTAESPKSPWSEIRYVEEAVAWTKPRPSETKCACFEVPTAPKNPNTKILNLKLEPNP